MSLSGVYVVAGRSGQGSSSGAGWFRRLLVAAGGSGKFLVKPDGPVREKSRHKIICPGTCYHTTGIML